MTRRKNLAASIIVLGVIGGGIMPSAAFAECPNFPAVPWWGKVSHDSVKSYVARKYDGDWLPYVKKWERQLSRMTDIRDLDRYPRPRQDRRHKIPETEAQRRPAQHLRRADPPARRRHPLPRPKHHRGRLPQGRFARRAFLII